MDGPKGAVRRRCGDGRDARNRASLLEPAEAGRPLVAPIGEDELQTLVRISRKTGHWSEEYFGECRFVKMTGKHGFQD